MGKKLIEQYGYEIMLCRSPKGEWHWKPSSFGCLDNLHRHVNSKGFIFVKSWSCYVATMVFIDWLWFRVVIKIKPQALCKDPSRYVPYEKTHFDLIGDVHQGDWDEK